MPAIGLEGGGLLQFLGLFCALVASLLYAGLLLRRQRLLLTCAVLAGPLLSLAVELADSWALLEPTRLLLWKKWALIAEASLPFGWLLFALSYGREETWRQLGRTRRLVLLASLALPLLAGLLPLADVFYSPDFFEEKILFLATPGYLFYVSLMLLLILALFYLEQTFVALAGPDRWRMKFEIIGAGLILAVLVLYYSQALLYRSLDMNLTPLRSTSLTLGLGLMAFSRKWRGEPVRIRVSRTVAYRSTVIMAVGVYLIGLGLFGSGLRYLDLAGNRTLLLALAVFFGLLLVILLLSERVRRRIRVALHKNFYQRKYDYRAEWLQFTSCLAEVRSREELEQALLAFFMKTFSMRSAALFLRDLPSGSYHCSAQAEVELASLILDEEPHLRQKMLQRNWVVDLQQETVPLPPGWDLLEQKGIAFLVPLCFAHELEGFIALGSRVYSEEALTYEDFDVMKILAHQAIGVLLSRKLYSELVAANEMAAIGRVSTFVIHDLKNLVSGLTLVVDNARDYIDDPDFRTDMFETLENTVANMKNLIARLQNVKQQPLLELAVVDLLATVQAAVVLSGNPAVEVRGSTLSVQADATELQKVVLNLLHNAREASDSGQRIEVEIGRTELAFVRVRDAGAGMSPQFIRTRLFKPFETTKKKGLGIGLYQCRQIVEAHGGWIEVESCPGVGSVFTLWLPLADS